MRIATRGSLPKSRAVSPLSDTSAQPSSSNIIVVKLHLLPLALSLSQNDSLHIRGLRKSSASENEPSGPTFALSSRSVWRGLSTSRRYAVTFLPSPLILAESVCRCAVMESDAANSNGVTVHLSDFIIIISLFSVRYPQSPHLSSRTYFTLIHLRSVGHATRCTMLPPATTARMMAHSLLLVVSCVAVQ